MKTRKVGTRLYNSNPRGQPRLKGLGYATRKKALESIHRMKRMPAKYQKQAATTMYYRAKHHKFRTKNMEEAMKVYKKFLSRLS